MLIKPLRMRWKTGNNYCYLLQDEITKHTWAIDPATPQDIIHSINPIETIAIVNTHHHMDHSGGNSTLLNQLLKGKPVIAGKDSPLVTYTPGDGEILKLGQSIIIEAIHTPCHTQDSICYYARDTETGQKALFTGDTLFTSGCGRFFEGTADQMITSLAKLTALPKDTKVYPGHEYTKDNVRFSKSVLSPHNEALLRLEAFANSHEETTGEFTIEDELNFNPFLRLDDPYVQNATGSKEHIEVLDKLRTMKNNF